MPPRTTTTIPKPIRILPRSAISTDLERQLSLRPGSGGSAGTEMRIGGRGHLPTGGRANHEADLEEKGLDHLGQRLRLVIDGGGDGFESHRTTTVLLDDGGKEAAVQPVESHGVHALAIERVARGRPRHHAVALDLDVVPHSAEEPVR